ncbi:hypothetical protein ONZ45_g18783 [Pleurotus djamor]|nr:hypothetical protein ONZ45_g18783 [Pleurotus djamor]
MTSQYSLVASNDGDRSRQLDNGEMESVDGEGNHIEGGSTRTACCSGMLCKIKEVLKRNVGLLLIVASQAFMSFMNVAVKKLNSLDPPVPALELVVVRMVMTYVLCMTYMLSRGVPDPWIGPKGVRALLVFRGVTGFFGLFGLYYSLQYLSLSDAVVLTFLSPLTTAISGTLILGESFSRKQAFAGLCSLFGVVLIARPAFIFGSSASSVNSDVDPTQRLIAVGVALLGVVGATGAYTTLRAIGKRAHPLHSMTSFSAQCVIVASTGLAVTKTAIVVPTKLEWMALLLLIGLCGFIAQTLLTMGLQRETASRGSLGIYTQIVFAGILERIFFHTAPSLLSAIGTIIIITCALYVVVSLLLDISSSSSYAPAHKLTRENKPQNKEISLERSDDADLEEGLLARSNTSQNVDRLELVGMVGGHVSVDDFRAGVASPSMKRSASPMPRALQQALNDEDLEKVPLEDEKAEPRQ